MGNSSNVAVDKLISQSGKGLLIQALWIAGFAAATALSARLEIPHDPVPFTLQTMVVLLAGAFLGARNGAVSQLLYLGAGILGAPVFAGGTFGAARLIGVTGGYLIAFPLAAAAVGYLLRERSSLAWTLISMASGLVIIFTIGMAFLYTFYLHDANRTFTSGFLLFTWWDLLKVGAAAMMYHEIGKKWPRLP
jgi:biotin transport system substrate-specific component